MNPHNGPSIPPRALICDLYGTVLRVGPPRNPDAASGWEALWRTETALPAPPVSLGNFNARLHEEILRRNAVAKCEGTDFPDALQPAAARAVCPALPVDPAALDRFLAGHARLLRTCEAMPGARAVLEAARAAGVFLGIASNAQPHTRHEMRDAGFECAEWFDPDLTVLSGECGLAKPSPAVFRLLGEKLAVRGVAAENIMMVGDREDNDILPAIAAGWQARLITGRADWDAVRDWITK